MEGLYRLKLMADEAEAYYTLWSRFPTAIIRAALDEYVRDETTSGRFPPAPAIIHRADRLWQAEIKQHQAEDRATDRLGWRQIEDKTRDDVGKATLPLILAYLGGTIDRAAYGVGVRDLDRRFPGLGFAGSADQVEGVTP